MFDIVEHTCDIVNIKLEPHPNADALSLVMIGDFQCVVRTEDWEDGDLAVYIPPDSVVPETKDFEFLVPPGSSVRGKYFRIKARKLRGEWSVGLLIPAPQGAKIGDDCMEQLGIVHYEPPIEGGFTTGGDNVLPPRQEDFSKYDVLNFRKYSELFNDGEEVIITEKLHGCNSRFIYIDNIMYCGSRRFWKKETNDNLWWKALHQNTALETWCIHNPGLSVFGEVFGQVQNLKYGATKGEIYFAAFDIWTGSRWLDFDEAHEIGDSLPWVPLVYRGPYNKDMVLEFAEGDSICPHAQHHREGVVIKPIHERTNRRIGRVQLKAVGNRYLSKS